MRPPLSLSILTLLIYSYHGAKLDKGELGDAINQEVSNTKQIEASGKIDKNKISKTALELDTLPNVSPRKMTQVSSGQISPYTTVKIDGCNFDLVTRGSDTVYLATRDNKFQTPEGFKIGTKFSELPKDVQRQLTKETGWGYYHQLSSGWMLGFCEGSSCTDNYPQHSSKVKWIFKRQ
jgi:hypothetical protein